MTVTIMESQEEVNGPDMVSEDKVFFKRRRSFARHCY